MGSQGENCLSKGDKGDAVRFLGFQQIKLLFLGNPATASYRITDRRNRYFEFSRQERHGNLQFSDCPVTQQATGRGALVAVIRDRRRRDKKVVGKSASFLSVKRSFHYSSVADFSAEVS